MNELIQVNDGQLVVSSRQVAEHFGKQHGHVLRDIECFISQNPKLEFDMFFESYYQAGTGKNYKEYLMNRDGFSLLAMGFTGKKALEWKLKYIQAFNEMEKRLNMARVPQSFAEALQLAADQAKALEAARPAVEFVERYVDNDGLKTLRETAKILEVPERKFIKWLQSKGIIYKHNGVNLPYQRYHKEGHFEVKTGDSDGFAFTQTRFTPKGIEWIHRLLLKDGGLV